MAASPDAARFFASGGQGDAAAVRERLAAMRRVIEERLSDVRVPWDGFVDALATRDIATLNDDGAVELALACACVEHEPRALARFEAEYISVVPPALAHMKLDASVVDDIQQAVRAKLLVADADGEVKLVRYAGGGTLRGLVKVTAVRTAISLLRKDKGADGRTADLDRLAEQTDNPELSFLKQHYRAAFAEAFEEAVRSLDERERNVMRLHLLGGMTLEEVARMYSVNRSTIVRTLQRARGRLLTETRKVLRERLSVSRTEFDSVVALIRSRLDVSLGRLLQTMHPDSE